MSLISVKEAPNMQIIDCHKADFSSCCRRFIAMRKRIGDRTDPWRMPLITGNLDYSESQGSCAEVELPPPVGVCRERESAVWVACRALVTMGDDVEALCLVKECRELERDFGTKFTEKLLKDGGDGVSKQHLKEIIFKIGRGSLLAGCAVVDKAPLVAKIAQEVGWKVVWDAALSRG